MNILVFFIAILFMAGIYFFIAEYEKISSIQTSKGIIFLGKGGQKAKTIDIYLDDIADKISKYIKLSKYKKKKLKSQLKAANINKTPEKHVASTIVKSGIPIIIGGPFLFVFPIIFPVLVIVSISTYFKEVRYPQEKSKKTREKIENELPKFSREIEQNLKSTRDVLFILENYKKNAGEALKNELEITVADMRTGNYETALSRFEMRVQSPMLSDIVKGLISVIRGDNAIVYFQMLSHDLKQLELQKLKKEATKRPGKIKKYSALILGCMLLLYAVVLIIAISQSSKGLLS